MEEQVAHSAKDNVSKIFTFNTQLRATSNRGLSDQVTTESINYIQIYDCWLLLRSANSHSTGPVCIELNISKV